MPLHPLCEILPLLTSLQPNLLTPGPHTADAFAAFEHMIHALFRRLADLFVATFLHVLLSQTSFQTQAVAAKKNTGSFRERGHRQTQVQLLGGGVTTLTVRALKSKPQGPRRRKARRGKGQGYQLMPALEALGLVKRCSPATWQAAWGECAAAESFEAAQAVLKRRGLDFSISRLHRLFEALGQRALNARQEALDQDHLEVASVQGRRVVIQMDGGRCRQRCPHQGRKKSNGYRDFEAPWVEPRQLVIYVLDDQGKLDRTWGKIADAQIADAPDFIEFLELYARQLKLEQADEVLLVADGQYWQWDRMEAMLERLGVESERITQVLDIGHALGRLAQISHVPQWHKSQRTRFYHHGKKLLKAGRIEELYEHCMSLAKGRRAKEIRSLSEYFVKHQARMQYATFRKENKPCGSGMVESMIRQVINMRLKSCGKFWKKENAQMMLCARSWLKTGRMGQLCQLMRRHGLDWLESSQPHDSCGAAALAA